MDSKSTNELFVHGQTHTVSKKSVDCRLLGPLEVDSIGEEGRYSAPNSTLAMTEGAVNNNGIV